MAARTVYMHTLRGQPAGFDGETVCIYAATQAVPAVRSLRQIRREQQASIRVRREWQMHGAPMPQEYGYVRIRIEEEYT